MGVMAYETQAHDGLYLCRDLTYFEFLDQEGRPAAPGEPARVVVTDLTGKLMPFIRYDQEDLVIFEYRESPDGTPEQILTQVMGRQSDYAVLPDGTICSPYTFSVLLKRFEGIKQFRVVQRAPDLFQILIVSDPSYVRAIHAELSERLARQFPTTVSFEMVQVERLDPDPSGKLRMLVCEVESKVGRDQTP
jgi:phenylacetate-CoA ligase